jgi:hypothetical protein
MSSRNPYCKIRRIGNAGKIAAIVMLMFFLLPSRSHAYLDLGTGSYVIQLLLAALFGAAFFVRAQIARLLFRIKKLFVGFLTGKRE